MLRPFSNQIKLVVLVGLVLQAGCSSATLPIPSHIHSETNAVAARQARDTMSDYAKNSPQMYQAMLQNVDLFKVDEEDLISQLAANESTALVTQLPSMTNQDFENRIQDEMGDTKAAKKIVQAAAGVALADMRVDIKELKDLPAAVKQAQSNVDAAKANVNAWNMNVALIQVAITKTPINQLQSAKAENLEALANKIRQEPVTYTDAEGKSQPTTVGEILNKNANSSAAIATNGGSLTTTITPIASELTKAPGLDLVLANLGLQVAQLEQKRAQLELDQARNLLSLLQSSTAQLDTSLELLSQADFLYPVSEAALKEPILKVLEDLSSGNDTALKQAAPDQQPPTSLRPGRPKAVRTQDNPSSIVKTRRPLTAIGRQKRLTGLLLSLRYEAVAESITSRVTTTNTLAFARLEHIRSIEESQMNDQEYQALITSGITGLVSYQEGGLTAQDIANVIAFAQAVAVGVLAGKVN